MLCRHVIYREKNMSNYTSKMLTHRIRKNDGHVMPDSIDSTKLDSELLRMNINEGNLDTENYAIRMRKYPIEKHLINGRYSNKVITETGKVW